MRKTKGDIDNTPLRSEGLGSSGYVLVYLAQRRLQFGLMFRPACIERRHGPVEDDENHEKANDSQQGVADGDGPSHPFAKL